MPSLSVDLRHTVHRTNHSDKHWGTAIVPVLSSPWGHVQVSILYEVEDDNMQAISVSHLPLSGRFKASITRSNSEAGG